MDVELNKRLRLCPDRIRTKPFRIAAFLIELCKLHQINDANICEGSINKTYSSPAKTIRTKNSIRPEVFLSKNPNAGRIFVRIRRTVINFANLSFFFCINALIHMHISIFIDI